MSYQQKRVPTKTSQLTNDSGFLTSVGSIVSDTAYDESTWNGVTDTAPSKNAVRDKFESILSDAAYNEATWNGDSTTAPSKNAVRDVIVLLELLSNKDTDVTLAANSDTLYPSQKAIKTYCDGLVAGLLDYRGGYDASGNVFPSSGGSGAAGAILKGDMFIITVPGTLGGPAVQVGDFVIAAVDTPGQTAGNWNTLNTNVAYAPEDSANKSTDGTFSANSDTLYPSQKAAKTYADTKQTLDATLTALAGLNTTGGMVTQTGTDTFTKRTLTGTSNRIVITNGDGVSGAPTFDIGTDVVTLTGTQTMTNKRITHRIGTEASSATSTPTGDSVDQWNVTALAAGDTIAAPTGTPTDGQNLVLRIKDNGTARALSFNAIYRASSDLALPTTTIISKTMYLGFKYNAADSKWDFLAFLNNF